MALTAVVVLALFCAAAIGYVYKMRGVVRYANFTEYTRKGWPVFSPLNCLLYLCTERRARKPIMDLRDFPDLQRIREQWQILRDEALSLHYNRSLEALNSPGKAAHYDVGFHSFHKNGWRKFYLKWYGYQHQSAERLCPQTVALLKNFPQINGALFSILPPGSHLSHHNDPFACSLRYHLGLMTPNSDACFIKVDGQTYSWRDGEALLFDETYIHHVRNDTLQHRLILMCDVERPMNFMGRAINAIYKIIMRLSVVPNTDEDKCGLISATFRSISPFLERGKELKAVNYRLYKLINRCINIGLLLLLLGILYSAAELIGFLAD